MKFNYFVFASSFFVLRVSGLDLLGLQLLNVPAIEKDGPVNVLDLNGRPTSKRPIQPSTLRPVFEKEDISNRQKECIESKTRINGGQNVCSGDLLFEDRFNTGQVNLTKWERQQYVAEGPDYEFVTYEKRAQNCFIRDGILNLKATLRDDPTASKVDLTNGCTGRKCSVAISPDTRLLPPIIAGKIKSRFSFVYGKIEVRAQLPKGDWIFPLVNLDPKGFFSYEKGRLWIAYARGNENLTRQETEEQIGNTVLYAGGVLDSEEPTRTYATLKISGEEPWGGDFHVFTMVWTPDGITIMVDGKEKGHISPPFSNSGSSYGVYWEGMAPFNQEYVISLGIAAGGFSDFPDGSKSSGSQKPWRKLSARPVVNFYEARDSWYPTWRGENSALKIDYVKVWAL